MADPISLTDFLIMFPKPANVSVSFPKDWGPEATNAFGASGSWEKVASAIGTAVSSFAGNSLSASASNDLGLTLNKNERVIFRTLPFRTVSFEWNLVPKSADEASHFLAMIDSLKVLTAPDLSNSDLTFTYPNTFSLEIEASQTIFKSPDMACTDLVVNYTPNSFWAQHKDKNPVSIGLQMSFMERELALKSKLGQEII